MIIIFRSVEKNPPWSMWRELLPCNETSCRSGIRTNNPHRRLQTHVIRMEVKCFYSWVWLQCLQMYRNYRQLRCFTWANELPVCDSVTKRNRTPVFCLSVWCSSVSACNNRFKVNRRTTDCSQRLTNYATVINHTRRGRCRHTQSHYFRTF